MEKRILSYDEYVSKKNESKEDVKHDKLDENILDSILRFFKGMFDLFNNKRLKKQTEESNTYFNKIADDESIPDDKIASEIDMKVVRQNTEKSAESIKDSVKEEVSKPISKVDEIKKVLAGWFAQIVVTQDNVMKMPAIQKILKNPELVKKLSWVPSEFRDEKGGAKKEWYKQKECTVDKNLITKLENALTLPLEKQDEAIKTFASEYIDYVISSLDGKEKLEDDDFLIDVLQGASSMVDALTTSIVQMLNNTPDEKAKEIIAKRIVNQRKKKRNKKRR